ncbi:hypothetical protein GQ457_15G018290 [Hibiscus cannabinus]
MLLTKRCMNSIKIVCGQLDGLTLIQWAIRVRNGGMLNNYHLAKPKWVLGRGLDRKWRILIRYPLFPSVGLLIRLWSCRVSPLEGGSCESGEGRSGGLGKSCEFVRGTPRGDGPDFYNSAYRRAIRLTIRDSLEEMDIPVEDANLGSKNEEHGVMKEARAVYEVSQILGISFKGGKDIVLKRVCELEEEGLGRREKVRAVKNLIMEQKPCLVFLQESKLVDPKPSLLRKLWNGYNIRSSFSPSIGSAGDLISLWNSDVFAVSSQIITQRYIAIIGCLKDLNWDCGFLNIYGPSVDTEKGQFFSEISEFLSNHRLSWCICGDFNLYLHEEEKLGGPTNLGVMEVLRNFIQESGLVDLPLKGGAFTWSNMRDPPTLVRLDRFLVSSDFLVTFQYLEQQLLSKSISYHHSISLINNVCNWGPRPFKFFNYHLEEAGFEDMVISSILKVSGRQGNVGVMKVLRNAKAAIKEWVGTKNNPSGNSKGAIELEIKQLEQLQVQGLGNSNSLIQIVVLRGKLWEILRNEERAWLQKSRLNWFKEGDDNTKFFHLMASNRRRLNSLNVILYNGVRVFEPPLIKQCVFDFFCKAYNEKNALPVEEMDFHFNCISSGQQAYLEAEFTEEEVWRAISSSDSNKAPGPDGFNMGFFKRFWPQLKVTIIKAFDDFHRGKNWEEEFNHSFITLISKKGCPESLEDYRPISLVGGIYKILSKVIAGRLKCCMETVISNSQFAFIQGCQILDCSFIANECIDEVVRSKLRGVVFKIDFSRAYDTVDWGFLIQILKEMNFGNKWCDWIFKCVSTATISVLVNGVPTDRFQISRGLRQGCSFSPYLFNIVGEAVNKMLSKAVEMNLFSGFKIGNETNESMVSHLQFADDLMIFCDASLTQIENVKRVLRVFELASGLQLNLRKCIIFGIKVPDNELIGWASSIGCLVGKFPTEYLGLPLGPKRNSVALWDPILEKFHSRLASWKSNCLSFGGRLAGGLGVTDLEVNNRALLGKWIWKFASDRKSLWNKIMVNKYRYDLKSLLPSSNVKGRPSWIWNNIVKSFEKEDTIGVCLRNNFKFQVGDGSSIRFWFECWLLDTPLKDSFPRIFAICISKQGTIAEFGRKDNGVWTWDIPLRRSLFDWEIEQWNSLLVLLQGYRANNFEIDWVRWEGAGDGKYSVKSLVNKCIVLSSSEADWGSLLWRGIPPPKVEVFTWLAIRQRIPVRVELVARGLMTSNNSLCPLCGLFPEDTYHLLFNCEVAWSIWMRCAALWGLVFVFPGDPGTFLLAWHDANISRSTDSIWHFFPFAILWSIWLFRNDIIFANGRLDVVQLYYLIRTRVATWYKAKFSDCSCTVDELISDPLVADSMSFSLSKVRKKLSWEAPPCGFLKLNVDGAMEGNGGKGGIGGLLRNNLGICLEKFSLPIGPGPPILAELEAILHGLKLFFSSRWCEKFRLVLECDCLTAID